MTHADVIWQLLTGLAVIVTVIATHLRARADRNTKQAVTEAKIQDVQETVNGTTHVLTGRVDQLTASLTASGIAVPPPPAGTPETQPEGA